MQWEKVTQYAPPTRQNLKTVFHWLNRVWIFKTTRLTTLPIDYSLSVSISFSLQVSIDISIRQCRGICHRIDAHAHIFVHYNRHTNTTGGPLYYEVISFCIYWTDGEGSAIMKYINYLGHIHIFLLLTDCVDEQRLGEGERNVFDIRNPICS